MKNWPRGVLYRFAAVLGLLVVLGGVVFAMIDPEAVVDPSRRGICERSGGRAPECTLPPESADKVLYALLSCSPDFFRILKEERAVFGPVEIRALPYNLISLEEPRMTVATFVKPIEAYGLKLIAYNQDWSLYKGASSEGYSWGFQVIESPAEVAKAIKARHPETEEFRAFGWERGAMRSGDWPGLIWTPKRDFPRTQIECFGDRGDNGMQELPHVADLLLSQSAEPRIFGRLRLFISSVRKTIADFRQF
ncbi:hypothetical protein [Sinorhizobium mexicanum]|uniref:Uncharacterized protein n=1 Tax=Sinorhizobium mexicanum TaxID=375549 RepID=A0A859QF85_9HYPH|nr:hypothetical protein [Sinorhizobium mexicanum]MBP1882390.1 hypothetical protein [Sinorhizobium mexicanum]QLL62094.1 hypothetical protein FKV68_11825 [Sinorhizobium mexicanum]